MPRESTRSRRGNISVSPSNPSPERRCRRCPGLPFLSQCEHTTAGRQYLEEQAAQVSTLNTVSKDVSSEFQGQNDRSKAPKASPRCTICDGRPLRSECVHTKKGQIFLRTKQIIQVRLCYVSVTLNSERTANRKWRSIYARSRTTHSSRILTLALPFLLLQAMGQLKWLRG